MSPKLKIYVKVTVMSEVISISVSSSLIVFKIFEKGRNPKNLISINLILISVLFNIFTLIKSFAVK